MAFDVDMIKKIYVTMFERINVARDIVNFAQNTLLTIEVVYEDGVRIKLK